MNPLEIAVRKALIKLMTAFPSRKQEGLNLDETVLVYLEAMGGLEPLDIDGGALRAIRNERHYFPNPGTLRAYALEERNARTVMVRPLVFTGDDVLCSVCGATRIWYREVTNDRGTFERCEVEHKWECPIKRPDQPALILTKGAA